MIEEKAENEVIQKKKGRPKGATRIHDELLDKVKDKANFLKEEV